MSEAGGRENRGVDMSPRPISGFVVEITKVYQCPGFSKGGN